MVNGYELKTGVVCLQCKICVIHVICRIRGEFLMIGRYTNLCTFSLYLFTCKCGRVYVDKEGSETEGRHDHSRRGRYQNISV